MKKMLLLFGVLIVLFSCTTALKEGGTLVLLLTDNGLSLKTILPPVDMDVDSYDIQGSGPFGDSFSLNVATSDDLVEVPSLEPGDWAIVVYAKNAGGSVIGSGGADVEIISGDVTTATITVIPIEGTGTLSVTVEWPYGVLASPSVTGTLQLADSGALPPPVPPPISFVLAGDELSSAYLEDLATGYYTLTVRLMDGPTVLWGTVEGARIVSGQISAKVYQLVSDVNQGGLALTIDPELENPIDITFTGQVEDLVQHGPNMDVIATTSETDGLAYQWYLQGEPIAGETTPIVTISSDLKLGTYWLSLVVTKGDVVSSGQIVFDVVSNGAGISIDPTNGLQTTEAGGTDTFDVVLDLAPTADVVITLASSDATEASANPGTLTFTALDWDIPQAVTVTGVDDVLVDGNQSYLIITDAASSLDPVYDGMNPTDVFAINEDDDSSGITIPADEPPGFVAPMITGTLMGKGTGKTFDYNAFDLGQTSFLVWGPSSISLPGLAFDGAVDEIGEELVYDAGQSDLANGVIVWTGSTDIYYLNSSWAWTTWTIGTRMTVTVTEDGVPAALSDVAGYAGLLPSNIVAVQQVDEDFETNLLLEAQIPNNFVFINTDPFGAGAAAGDYVPAVDLFDELHTDPLYDNFVISNFGFGFYYTP